MTKIDFVFYMLAAISYIMIIYHFKDQEIKLSQMEEIAKKREMYEMHLKARQEREMMKKAEEEKRLRQKAGLANMTSTVEMLSNFSDKEVMRQSRITSGKY